MTCTALVMPKARIYHYLLYHIKYVLETRFCHKILQDMWRPLIGLLLIIAGFSALGIELYAIISFESYLAVSPVLTIIRISIWVVLVALGFRLRKHIPPQDYEE